MDPVRAILDTSILVAAGSPDLAGLECRISSVSYAELQFGLTVARDDHERNQRMLRFNRILSLYGNGVAFDDRVAGSYAYLTGLVKEAGRNPRRRTADLMIAATAHSTRVALVTRNPDDLGGLETAINVLVR